MKSWDLSIKSGNDWYLRKAELMYESKQILRIKVSGKTRSMTLQNDYPIVKLSKGHKQIKWKLLDGRTSDPELLTSILTELERLIKKDFPHNTELFE